MSRNPHKGTNFYDYLKEEGMSKEVHTLMKKKYGHLMEKEEKDKSGLLGRIRNLLNSIIGFIIS